MRVSIALHRAEPLLSSNQRDAECNYMNYNRQYAELDANGNCLIDVDFVPMGETVEGDILFVESWKAKYFSIGICEGVPQDTGGQIINYAPLYEPVPVVEGTVPKIKCVMHVTPERMAECQLS